MRKILLGIILALLVLLAFFFVRSGIKIGNFQIMGIIHISEESKEMEQELENLTKITNIDFPQRQSELDKSVQELKTAKQTYEEKSAYSTDDEIVAALRNQTHEVEHLLTKVGTYATKEGIGLNINPQTTGVEKTYDLIFTAEGRYIGIIDFLYAIEDDNELEFKIENFKLLPSTTNSSLVVATFTVKNVRINIGDVVNQAQNIVTNTTENETEEEVEEEEENTNNTSNESTNNTAQENTANENAENTNSSNS